MATQSLNTTISSTACCPVTEADWKQERKKGVGASEAAAIVGMSPYKTNATLWEEKTGRREPDDLINNPFVAYGKAAEEPIRQLFMLDNPEYKLEYNEFKIIRNPEHPFIFATLDGELTDTRDGRRGIYEGKTTEIMNSRQWALWKDRIPDSYYIQLIHQLLATGWDFAILNAQIKYTVGSGKRIKRTEEYVVERKDAQEDMDWLLEREIEFWRYVQNDTRPGLMLPAV